MNFDRRSILAAAVAVGLSKTFLDVATAAEASDPMIDTLLASMTLEEKAGQLTMEGAKSPRMGDEDFRAVLTFLPAIPQAEARASFQAQLDRVRRGEIGSMLSPLDVDSTEALQRAAVEQSRLKIPLLFASDTVHGYQTTFPVPLAEAASFEPDLARRTARAAAVEATAAGHDATFAPMVDIGRDQRWGRVVEGAGEDVLLGARFAAARVQGFQGERRGAADSLLACAKHFAAYGAGESGLDYQGAAISERVLREVYLPPFKAAFDAGAIFTMAAFNTVDGVPATGNRRLLSGILRSEFGFTGAVVSDYESDKELIAHGYAADDRDAALRALTAGCDISMVSGIYLRHVPDLVRSGALDVAVVDQAVRRVLFLKREAGLLDRPFLRIDKRRAQEPPPREHRALAREAGRKSIVLLKNENRVLPLPKQGVRIALIGPFGADTANLNGPWSGFFPAPSVSVEAGLRGAMRDPNALSVVPGSGVNDPIAGGIDAAVAAARMSDVVILAIGEASVQSGEAASRAEIVVPAPQRALAEAVAATGKPLVVVLRNGRALALDGAVRDAQAIVVGWFLGAETGAALADVLFGDVSPAGRLPVTFPRTSGQQPYYYARERSGRPSPPNDATSGFKSHFLGLPDAPLYPFGHGLTYGDVRYGATTLSAPTLTRGGVVEVVAAVTNAGDRAATETVQLYIHDRVASVVQPVRRLADFRKVALRPGETAEVRFTLTAAQLAFVGRDMTPTLESGAFDVWIAPNAMAGEPAALMLL